MEYDVVIVGGGPAGLVSALTVKQTYPEKTIAVIRGNPHAQIPCGIPYTFVTLKEIAENALPDQMYQQNNIRLIIDDVLTIDKENKRVGTRKNGAIGYDRLILATGSLPVKLEVPGNNLEGIHYVYKDQNHVRQLKEHFQGKKHIVIIGGGHIGVEFADEFSNADRSVIIVEKSTHILNHMFDKEMSQDVHKELADRGVKILTERSVDHFEGDNHVSSVVLDNGESLQADFVIVGIGAKPNVDLAMNAGLDIDHGAIAVDDYQRTRDEHIFAIGDCALKLDFITGKPVNVLLASSAVVEAKFAGANLFGIKLVRQIMGTVASSGSVVGNLRIASTGITEEDAMNEGFNYVSATAEVDDKHPCSMPNDHKIKLKAVFSSTSGIFLGCQVIGFGNDSVGELINMANVVLEKRMNINEIESLQLASHPKLHPSPMVYPLVMAATQAMMQLQKK